LPSHFSSPRHRAPPYLPSFPTRRSSDLQHGLDHDGDAVGQSVAALYEPRPLAEERHIARYLYVAEWSTERRQPEASDEVGGTLDAGLVAGHQAIEQIFRANHLARERFGSAPAVAPQTPVHAQTVGVVVEPREAGVGQ